MTKVAVIGTGLMGEPLARRLQETGIEVIAYNRSEEKLTGLAQIGIEVTTEVKIALEKCDCALLMLTNAEAIAQVLLTENLQDKVIIQMGTIAPGESRELLTKITSLGGEYLEAPVLGSIPEVKNGKLLVMVGSTEEQFERWSPLLANLGPDPLYTGVVGTASALKLALNQLIASLTAAFALSLNFVQRQGVEVEQFMSILRQSALYAPTFDKKLGKMCDRSYANPNFPTKHLLKDVNLFLSEAENLGVSVDSLIGVRSILEKAIELGLAEEDYSALFEAIPKESATR